MATSTADPRVVSLRTSDLDEAWSFLDPLYYRSYTRLADRSQRLDARIDVVQLGPVTLAEARFGAELEVSIQELDSYHINIPCSGRLCWGQGSDAPLVIEPGAAAVYQRLSSVDDRWSADCSCLSLKIEPGALHAQLEQMLGVPVTSPVSIEARMDTARGPGASWAGLVRLLAADAGDPRGLAHHPLIRDQLIESLLSGLLLSAEHRYRGALEGGTPHLAAPRPVRQAMELVQAHPESPLTLASLADIAGVSQRTLQAAFQQHVGTSPMRYLRDVRLARAHDDLRSGTATTVAAVAYTWGFAHLGRFSGLYRERYGVTPSQELRSGH